MEVHHIAVTPEEEVIEAEAATEEVEVVEGDEVAHERHSCQLLDGRLQNLCDVGPMGP